MDGFLGRAGTWTPFETPLAAGIVGSIEIVELNWGVYFKICELISTSQYIGRVLVE
jgi:hypothetical protein